MIQGWGFGKLEFILITAKASRVSQQGAISNAGM